MTLRIFRPTYVIEELGELGAMPDGGIANIGGVSGPVFTVGGKQVLLADSNGVPISTLQGIYLASTPAHIDLTAGRDFVITGLAGKSFTVDAATGNVTISGLINGLDLTTLASDIATLTALAPVITTHLDAALLPAKHTAAQISADTAGLTHVAGSNVQQVIASIDGALANVVTAGASGYEHVEATPNIVWTIVHNRNTRRVQVTVWDETDIAAWPDTISIVDANTVRVVFNTPAAGRAILMLF